MSNLTFSSGQLVRVPKNISELLLGYPIFDSYRYANNVGMILKHRDRFKVIWGDNVIKVYENKQLEELFFNNLLEFIEDI